MVWQRRTGDRPPYADCLETENPAPDRTEIFRQQQKADHLTTQAYDFGTIATDRFVMEHCMMLTATVVANLESFGTRN